MFNSKKTNKQEAKSNKNESEIQTLSADQLAAVSGGCCCCCHSYRPRRGHYGRWC